MPYPPRSHWVKCFVFKNLLWETSQTTAIQLLDSKDDRQRPFPAGIDSLPSDGRNLIIAPSLQMTLSNIKQKSEIFKTKWEKT